MIIIEHNVETGEITERDMNAKEVKELEKVQSEATAELNAKVDQKAAILDRLGITEEEARLLLG